MPCNSDHLNPNLREKQLQETAICFLYLLTELDKRGLFGPVLEKLPLVEKAAKDIYCKADFVADLCKVLRNISQNRPNLFKEIVFNGANRQSRRLADWWEEHQRADKAREDNEKRLKRQANVRMKALAKLNTEEKIALGLQ